MKDEVKKKFIKFTNFLKTSLRSKYKVIRQIQKNRLDKRYAMLIKKIPKDISNNTKKEIIFKKLFFAPAVKRYFINYPIDVIIEGINSKGKTQIKKAFLGSKPTADFIFESTDYSGTLFSNHKAPLPLETAGEIKFGDLNFRSFMIGLAQLIGYLRASLLEDKPKIYGYYIFFNTDDSKEITNTDKDFLDELWEKENIFVVIL